MSTSIENVYLFPRLSPVTNLAVGGGTGFISANLTQRILSECFDVIVVDDLSTGLLSNIDQQRITLRQISITDSRFKRLHEAF